MVWESRTRPSWILWLALALLPGGIWQTALADVDLPTKFTNQGSIANTRHNLTQRPPAGGVSGTNMNPYRNDYNEVCVYCHTPHGANTTIAAPLWNRTNLAAAYTVYNLVSDSANAVSQPGANSLTCLSCHDGRVAVDSIINMPGSGRYSAAQQTVQSNTFLNAWKNSTMGAGGPDATIHIGLSPGNTGCLACHSPGAGIVGAGAPDLTVTALGTDLRDDHPVGVQYPATGPNVDFNAPTATAGAVRFFDTNGNGRADKREVRLYNSGGGFEVECASCHDPHGVPSGGAGSVFLPTFLRVSNAGSALCLTCHVK